MRSLADKIIFFFLIGRGCSKAPPRGSHRWSIMEPTVAAPAAAAAPPVDIFKLVADKVLEQEQERDVVAGVESELLFVGAKNSGKSTLIHSFLMKEDTPKPTSALEYRFARRSTGEDKAVANIWELGGGSQLRCAACKNQRPACCLCTARLHPST